MTPNSCYGKCRPWCHCQEHDHAMLFSNLLHSHLVLSWQRLSDSQRKSGIVQLTFLVSRAYYLDKPLRHDKKYCISFITSLVSLPHKWWGIGFHSFTLALTVNKNATNAALSLSLVFNVQQRHYPQLHFCQPVHECAAWHCMLHDVCWWILQSKEDHRLSRTAAY